ncbi:hypothetical protein [Endozoicomonas sp. ALD040]|uniref:hypothetical protein n=1 Tax=Endozoicomonas sp. ALD040 TaxID=3403079 RepID=UPI003BB0130D
MIKLSLFAALLLMLVSLSVIGQTESTSRFIVELEQNADAPIKNFTINIHRRASPCNPSNIADTKGYSGSDLPPEKKCRKPDAIRVKKNITEMISWQLIYATNLLVAYELILTTKGPPLNSNPYAWLPLEVVVSWLLKSYWNPDSWLFNPIEQQASQGLPFASITIMSGSGQNQEQYSPSKSSCQQAPPTTTRHTASFAPSLNTDYADGNGDPQQPSHSLDLNCYVYPCNGVCRFRSSSDSTEPPLWTMDCEENSCPHLANGHCLSCIGHLDPLHITDFQKSSPFKTPNDLSKTEPSYNYDPQPVGIDSNSDGVAIDGGACTSNAIVQVNYDAPIPEERTTADNNSALHGSLDMQSHPGEDKIIFTLAHSETQTTTTESFKWDQYQPHHIQTAAIQPEYCNRQKTCDAIVVGKDHKERPCGIICKDTQALRNHKRKKHSGQQTCDLIVVGEDGQLRPCGRLFQNIQSLATHKSGQHSGQKTCKVIVVGEDGLQRPCGAVWKNANSLTNHKTRVHSGQRVCTVNVIGEDGQLRPCGAVCKSTKARSDHKRTVHSSQQTCNMTVLGQDGQERPCGMVTMNLQALTTHRSYYHTAKKICDVILIGKDDQPQPCGMICTNSRALWSHKRRYHTRQQTCDVNVTGEDGLARSCGMICENPQALLIHKKKHRKRKPVNVEQDDDSAHKKRKPYN